MSQFRKKIYQLIAENLGFETEEINGKLAFAEDFNAGEIEMAELIENIEQELQIKLDPEEVAGIETVDDLVHAVFDKLDGILEEEDEPTP